MLRWIVLLTLGNFISGRLALLLAIPPGYATAIWPPIGLSLAAVLLLGKRVTPGIWLGSFFVNISKIDHGLLSLPGLFLPAVIATGTTLTVLLAEWCIVKKLKWPKLYTGERDIVWLLLLAGPVPSLFSSLWGTSLLLLTSTIPASAFVETIFTWWVGDSIGGMLLTPLLIVLFQKRFHGQGYQVKKLHVVSPMFTAALFTIFMFLLSSYRENQIIDERLSDSLIDQCKDIQRDSFLYEQMLLVLSESIRAQRDFDGGDFKMLTQPYLGQLSGLESVAWVAKDVNGKMAITYVDPKEELAEHMGHAFEKGRVFEGIERCIRDKKMVSTKWQVPWNADVQKYVLSFPVGEYENDAEVKGVLLALVDIRDFMHATLRHAMPRIIQGSWVTDMDLGRTVYEDILDGVPVSLIRQMDLFALNRNWYISLVMNPEYVSSLRRMDSWFVLVGGFSMVAILGGLLMLISGRSVEVNQLVEDKTKGILDLNVQLKEEVSQRIELEKGMLVAKEEAERTSEAKSSFLARMSHEMRTPLNQIKLPLQLLKEVKGLDSDQSRLCDMADRACSHILGIVEDVILYTNLSEDSVVLSPEPMIVHKFLREESFSWESDCQSKGLVWQMKVSEEVLVLLIHQEGLRVILDKLVNNAIKFTEAGGVFLECEIKTEEADRAKVMFSLQDTGIGIPAEDQDRIISAFEQQEGALRREHGGIGLGLTLVREWVRLMGGRLNIDSHIGKGTKVTVELDFERIS